MIADTLRSCTINTTQHHFFCHQFLSLIHICLRVNGATAELEALGEETDHYSSSTTRLREALLHLTGVDIAFDNGSLKSTAQIMKELSEVWNTLGDSRSTAIKVLAGNDQSGVVKSLLDNTGTVSYTHLETVIGYVDEKAGVISGSLTALTTRVTSAEKDIDSLQAFTTANADASAANAKSIAGLQTQVCLLYTSILFWTEKRLLRWTALSLADSSLRPFPPSPMALIC